MGRVKRGIPDWITLTIPAGPGYALVKKTVAGENLHTVCVEARCPNAGECFREGTATFLILGGVCTRHCRYCAVSHGTPGPVDLDEPRRVANAVKNLGLRYAVITSVTRDDIADGGASLFAETVTRIRSESACGVELLIPDFKNSAPHSLAAVIAARPDVINHNIEVVRALFPKLRPQGSYDRSLQVISAAADSGLPAKSGLMIGFGETMDDIEATLRDLRGANCGILTVGQYLRSWRDGFPVVKFYRPDEFDDIRAMAVSLGFSKVLAGPLVRSSYHAGVMARS